MCYKQKCKVVSLNLAHPVQTDTGYSQLTGFSSLAELVQIFVMMPISSHY